MSKSSRNNFKNLTQSYGKIRYSSNGKNPTRRNGKNYGAYDMVYSEVYQPDQQPDQQLDQQLDYKHDDNPEQELAEQEPAHQEPAYQESAHRPVELNPLISDQEVLESAKAEGQIEERQKNQTVINRLEADKKRLEQQLALSHADPLVTAELTRQRNQLQQELNRERSLRRLYETTNGPRYYLENPIQSAVNYIEKQRLKDELKKELAEEKKMHKLSSRSPKLSTLRKKSPVRQPSRKKSPVRQPSRKKSPVRSSSKTRINKKGSKHAHKKSSKK